MNILQERAQTFNANAAIYNDVRPGYPEELYRDIQAFAGITATTRILEIGAGNGIASYEMAARWNARITSIEPGAELLNFARQRCRQYPNVRFVHSTFEEYDTPDIFDVIVSATAYHWIDPAIKLTKPAKLLTNTGILAVFWNNYWRDDHAIFDEINAAYAQFHPAVSGSLDVRRDIRAKIQARIDELKRSPALQYMQHTEYTVNVPFTTDGYVKLLRTFSLNAVCAPDEIAPFYEEIRRIFARHGNTIMLPVLVNLEILQNISTNIS